MSNIHLHYLSHHLTRQLNELYVSTVIFAFGQSMMLVFVPIFLFEKGFSIAQIILYFSIHYLFYAVLMLPIGKIIAKIGYENSIGWSMPLYGIYIGSLLLIPAYPILLFINAFLWALYKAFYWPAFHADFTKFGDVDARGEEISSLGVLVGMVSIMGPTIGGYVIAQYGFNWMFIITLILSFLSLIPLLKSKEKYKPESFSIKNIVKDFFSKKYRNDMIANLGTGEDIIAQSVWPIFLLTIFTDYKDIGVLTTIALFIAFIIILVMGKLANKPKKTRLIKTTSVFLALSWFFRIFSFNWLSIFASDAVYKISKKSLLVPVQALIYDRPKGKNLLHYLILREIALAVSKGAIGLVAFVVMIITGQVLLTFLLAGVVTFFYFYWGDQIIDDDRSAIVKMSGIK